MKDYRNLTPWQQEKVDEMIKNEIEPGHHINPTNGYEWDEPGHTLISVHLGHNCAECLMTYYNCLCGHE